MGLGAAVWPLIDQMNPDKSVQALATTEVDISSVELQLYGVVNQFLKEELRKKLRKQDQLAWVILKI